MDVYCRRKEDKHSLLRRKDDNGMIRRFDRFIESRTSIILNWLWKSGLLLFLITLICQNLSFQKSNSDELVASAVKIRILTDNANIISDKTNDHEDKIADIEISISNNISDINYLRRDVDGLLRLKRNPVNIKGE